MTRLLFPHHTAVVSDNHFAPRHRMIILKEKYSRVEGVTTIAILADPACRKGWERNFPPMLEKVWKEHAPQLFIVAGDLALNATAAEYHAIFRYLDRYPATLAAVPGDHDRPLGLFRKHFGALRKVVDAGRWRFIGINTSNRMFLARERKWIDDNVRADSIIFSHLPPEADGWTFHSLWPRSSDNFLATVKRHRKKIHSMYFGHIHGYSERSYLGIPMTVTGALAESLVVKDNRYQGKGFFEMVIFDANSGNTRLCKMP
ncbi:MAG TPA: metallophosphoesterase [Spirochaetota bacterium]|nr:metallophosphoesterase [Spirochaetota bacterium]